MNRTDIIGRKKEIEILEKALKEKEAQLLIVSGRRRVGKTFLINSFFEDNFTFSLTATYNQTLDFSLGLFNAQFNKYFNEFNEAPKNWGDAFSRLGMKLKSLPSDEKKIVFIDELPWFDHPGSNFVSYFESFRNNECIKIDNLVFIVCGSKTSRIHHNLFTNKGGFYNRQTYKITLEPFSLKETQEFLSSRNVNYSHYDVAIAYMCMGGIPYYLKFIDGKLTLSENINKMFFEKNCYLNGEAEQLFRTLFENVSMAKRIIEALSNKRYGMTRKEISKAVSYSEGGKLTDILEDLMVSGFISTFDNFSNVRKEKRYILTDLYSLFYFKFVKANTQINESFWTNAYLARDVKEREGFSFELICRLHINEIKKALNILSVDTKVYSWNYYPEDGEEGAQIDLVIERKDNTIDICEMKFVESKYEITKNYYDNCMNKIEKFSRFIKKRQSLRFIFISTEGIKNNKYSNFVAQDLNIDIFFN